VRGAVLVLVLGLAGCAFDGGGGVTIDLEELPSTVLQPADLSVVFQRFDEGRQVLADNPGGSRSDRDRFGRRDGWKARYHRPGGQQTGGPLVVESRVDLFESSSGAVDDLEAAREDLTDDELEWQPIDEPGLGDESFAATVVEPGLGEGVRHYRVYWRDDNVTAFVNVNGFEGRLTLEEVLELARKQQERISKAAESS
jgi:hypothetical protein